MMNQCHSFMSRLKGNNHEQKQRIFFHINFLFQDLNLQLSVTKSNSLLTEVKATLVSSVFIQVKTDYRTVYDWSNTNSIANVNFMLIGELTT